MTKFGMMAWVAVAALAGVASAAVELAPFRVVESRSVALAADTVGHNSDSLTVTLALKGPEAEAAVKYGELKLETAVDDKGTNLIPKKDSFGEAKKMKEYANQFFRKFDLENKRPAAAPQVEIGLNPAARAATKIATLKGEFTLMTAGEVKVIEAKGQKAGTLKMEIPKEAGVGVTLTVSGKADEAQLEMAVTGDESALESLEVVDAKGEKVSSGMSSFTMNGVKTTSLDMAKPLDETMKVVAKVVLNRKSTKVPFELKDIALP